MMRELFNTFIVSDDFRIVAASSMLKIVVARQTDEKYGEDLVKIQNGQNPPAGIYFCSCITRL